MTEEVFLTCKKWSFIVSLSRSKKTVLLVLSQSLCFQALGKSNAATWNPTLILKQTSLQRAGDNKCKTRIFRNYDTRNYLPEVKWSATDKGDLNMSLNYSQRHPWTLVLILLCVVWRWTLGCVGLNSSLCHQIFLLYPYWHSGFSSIYLSKKFRKVK